MGSQRRRFLFRITRTTLLILATCGPSPIAGGGESKDSRLVKAVTLDDYHPWTPPRSPEAWAKRATCVREQILVAAGLWPMPPAEPLDPMFHGRIEREGYTIEKVWFRSFPGVYVTGNLYRPSPPRPGRGPAVLCPHGHWQNGRLYENSLDGARKEVEKGAERTMEGARYPLQARSAMLARMGATVLFYDMVGNADLTQIPHGAGFGDLEAELWLQSAFGLQLYHSIRAFDFLSSLPEVDPARIGVTGASGGGTQTFFLSAVDSRPAALFPAVMVSTAMQGGCTCENATLLRVGTGNIEFAALSAPRPLGMTGANDWTLEIETKGLPELKALYGMLGAGDLVEAKCFPQFDHNYNQPSRERMYAWFRRHLKLEWPEPVVEQPFEPVPPAELRVFDAEHPRPSDSVDAVGLRKHLTALSRRAAESWVPRDAAGLAESRRVLFAALRAIVVDELPEAVAALERKDSSRWSAGSFEARSLLLSRRGSGEELPVTWYRPSEPKGPIVVLVTDDAARGEALGEGAEPAPGPIARRLLEGGAQVLVPEVFLTGRLRPADSAVSAPVDRKRHGSFVGYTWGYNRTISTNRVHDVLTAIACAAEISAAAARGSPRPRLAVLGLGEGGLWALLGAALAGEGVSIVAVDRPSKDLGEAAGLDDPAFFPGGAKYGGWGAFSSLLAPRPLTVRGDGALPAILEAAYAASGAREALRTEPSGSPRVGLAEAVLR